jgi:hypothetical protein
MDEMESNSPSPAHRQAQAARQIQIPIGNCLRLVTGKPAVRGYKAVYVLAGAGFGQLSDEVVMTATP